MSQSDSSVDSAVTVHPVSYLEIMSLAGDDEDDDDGNIEMPVDGVMVLREELETLLRNMHVVLDSAREAMGIVQILYSSMENN